MSTEASPAVPELDSGPTTPSSVALTPRRPTGLLQLVARRVGEVPRADLVALVAIVAVASVLAVTNVVDVHTYLDDEGTYSAQARAVQSGSLAPYTYWYDHPPFGWIQLALLGWIPQLLHLGDGTGIGTMRYVMAAYFVVDAALLYGIARRLHVVRVLALVVPALFLLSPLSLGQGRQVFLDNVAMPWLLLAFFLVLSPRMSLWSHSAAGGAFAVAVLTKLTAAIAGPALLFALVNRSAWRGRSFSVVGFLTVGALVLLNFPVLALLRGELLAGEDHVSLQEGLVYQFATRSGSGEVWVEGSARQGLLLGWMQIDGFLIGAGSIAAIVCLFSRPTRWIPVAIGCFLLPIALGSGYLPDMYIAGGIPFFCLAVGTAAHLVARAVARVATSVAPRLRHSGVVGVVVSLVLLASQLPVASWSEKDRELMTQDANADWRATLAWASENIPHDDVVLSPYSMWEDLDASGWDDPWTMIVLEKADLDSEEYTARHPEGWKEIEWIIEGPTVASNLGELGLQNATTAFEHSSVVQEFGLWRVREVDPDGPSVPVPGDQD